MSCEYCKGGGDVEYTSIKTKAEQYVEQNKKDIVIYFDGVALAYMEAQIFFQQPCGQLIECLSPLQGLQRTSAITKL